VNVLEGHLADSTVVQIERNLKPALRPALRGLSRASLELRDPSDTSILPEHTG